MLKDIIDNNRFDAHLVCSQHSALTQTQWAYLWSKCYTYFWALTSAIWQSKPNLSLADYIRNDREQQEADSLYRFLVQKNWQMNTRWWLLCNFSAVIGRPFCCAEHLHERIRKEFWGYKAGSAMKNWLKRNTSVFALHPCLPWALWKGSVIWLVKFKIGTKLTEHFAMIPPSSVSIIHIHKANTLTWAKSLTWRLCKT